MDGITVFYHESRRERFLQICTEWEERVGNNKMGKLEETSFLKVFQESINHYISLKRDMGIKKKGRFATEFELNKNKSKRIIPLAIEAYFINGINPIQFIENHSNIFDFCIAKKSSRSMHYEEIIDKDNVKIHKKLIRYFVSNNGNVIKKRGFDFEGKAVDSFCEATDNDFPWMGQPKLTYFNRFYKDKYDINYSYYILETLKRIDKIEKTNKAKIYADTFKTEQLTLW
jgi:hypothetical protein